MLLELYILFLIVGAISLVYSMKYTKIIPAAVAWIIFGTLSLGAFDIEIISNGTIVTMQEIWLVHVLHGAQGIAFMWFMITIFIAAWEIYKNKGKDEKGLYEPV